MAITAKDVQELRAKTGIGMMECKKALTEANGDMDEAIKILREKGLAVAAKKASRIAAEGVVDIAFAGDVAAMIEVNIETDFAANSDAFTSFVKELLAIILDKRPANVEELLTLPYSAEMNVEAALKDKIFSIGENISIRRFVIVEGATNSYIHGKGSIGVVVKLADPKSDNALYTEAAKNLALQIAAMNPTYLNAESVPADVLKSEKEIVLAQMAEDEKAKGKPQAILEKMAEGKLKKFFTATCLVDQEYVKEDKMTVAQYLASVAKEIGSPVACESFVRFERGEGIEKKEEDYAAEVAKLAGTAK
ncbi:MAG: elongation factor Ts [Clostridia bacterium]|nr:elongation factor Ts [Clostridia bacterium]